MTLLSPLWLAALGALALPIVLHLISRGRLRRVRVASIRLLAPGESRRARRLRPTQRLLLALRCALLAALALALAGPRWTRAAATEGVSDWVLVSPALLDGRLSIEPSQPAAYAELDAMVEGGAELRLLAPGFEHADGPHTAGSPAEIDDAWSLLAEADARAPAGAAFHVVVADRLEALYGSRPTLTRPVRWIPVPLPGANRWIERGRSVRGNAEGDAGRYSVVVADSDQRRTAMTPVEVPPEGSAARTGAPGAVTWEDDGRFTLTVGDAFAGDDAATARTSAAVEAVVFHTDERAEDARYVRAALAAAAGYTGIPVRTRTLSAPVAEGDVKTNGARDLVFWLSPATVPNGLLSGSSGPSIVVSDGGALYESCAGNLILPYAGGIALRRCSPPAAGDVRGGASRGDFSDDVNRGGDGDVSGGARSNGGGDDIGGRGRNDAALALWTDGTGRPLLDAQRVGHATHLRFHGRFHPAWSDLPTDAALPAWVADLVERAGAAAVESSATARSDRRAAGAQGAPQERAADGPATVASAAPQNLLWLFVALLLVSERALAARSLR